MNLVTLEQVGSLRSAEYKEKKPKDWALDSSKGHETIMEMKEK